MGAPEGGLRECAHKRYPQTCEFDPTHVLKAMFPLITGSPLAGRYTATHCIVVPRDP